MYRVIVIDDEEEIRHGISSFIASSNGKFEVTAEFEDGKDAIEYLSENDVEVVVTDICMSDVPGLEVLKYIAKNKPYIKTVVISGYKDFEYVQTALENRAEYYITKPTRFKELIKTFNELEAKLDEIESQKQKRKSEIQKVNFFREELLCDIYYHKLDSEKYEKKIEILDEEFDLRDSCFFIIKLYISNYEQYLVQKWKYGYERFDIAVNNIVKQFYCSEGFQCCNLEQKNGEYKYIIYFSQFENFDESLNNVSNSVEKLKTALKELANFESDISMINYYETLADFIKGNDQGAEISGIDNDIILKAKSYICKNIGRDISLDEVAKYVHLSSIYFSKYFKLKTGENYSTYLTNLRINMAIELLKEQNSKISEIGEKVGYYNYSYFSRIFKTSTGYSPSEYVRKVLQKYEN